MDADKDPRVESSVSIRVHLWLLIFITIARRCVRIGGISMFIRRIFVPIFAALAFCAVAAAWWASSSSKESAAHEAPDRAESLTLDDLVTENLRIFDLG